MKNGQKVIVVVGVCFLIAAFGIMTYIGINNKNITDDIVSRISIVQPYDKVDTIWFSDIGYGWVYVYINIVDVDTGNRDSGYFNYNPTTHAFSGIPECIKVV